MEISILMHLLGFESASESKLNYMLPRINCLGSTAFRDAVYKGNQLMLELYGLCAKFNAQDHFKFVHVVLTDGEDNSSNISLEDFLLYQLILEQKLPKNILQTFYIGVNVENNQTVKQEMQAILQCSGSSAQYYSISSNGINDIFQKIQMQIGIRVQERNIVIGNQQAAIALRQQQVSPILQFQINNYIVLFTLDISSSMQPNWNKVCQAVKGFLGNLGENDLVLGIVFNEQVQVLSGNQVEKSIQLEDLEQPQDQQSQEQEEEEVIQYQDEEQSQEIINDQTDNLQVTPLKQEGVQTQQSPQSQQKPISEQQLQTQQESPQQYKYEQHIPIDKPQNQTCHCQINCQIF